MRVTLIVGLAVTLLLGSACGALTSKQDFRSYESVALERDPVRRYQLAQQYLRTDDERDYEDQVREIAEQARPAVEQLRAASAAREQARIEAEHVAREQALAAERRVEAERLAEVERERRLREEAEAEERSLRAQPALRALRSAVDERIAADDWEGAGHAVDTWFGEFAGTGSQPDAEALRAEVERGRQLAHVIASTGAARLSRPARLYASVDGVALRSIPELNAGPGPDIQPLRRGEGVDAWYRTRQGWLLVALPGAEASGGRLTRMLGWLRAVEVTEHDIIAEEDAARDRQAREAAEAAARREAAARIQAPQAGAVPAAPGTPCLANFHGLGRYYAGVITALGGGRANVVYADGMTEAFSISDLLPDTVGPGTLVEARTRTLRRFYPGRVTQRIGHAVFVRFDDGDYGWTSIALVRVSRANIPIGGPTFGGTTGEGAAPGEVGSELLANYHQAGLYYVAVVIGRRANGLVEVVYADGDSEALPLSALVLRRIAPGMVVQLLAPPLVAAATVLRRQSHGVLLRFVDGSTAWFSIANVRSREAAGWTAADSAEAAPPQNQSECSSAAATWARLAGRGEVTFLTAMTPPTVVLRGANFAGADGAARARPIARSVARHALCTHLEFETVGVMTATGTGLGTFGR